jgi:hypothetical protein
MGKLNQIFGVKTNKEVALPTDIIGVITEQADRQIATFEQITGKQDYRIEKLENMVGALLNEIKTIASQSVSSPKAIVKEIEVNEESKNKVNKLNEIAGKFNEVYVTHLYDKRRKLYSVPKGKKMPVLTKEGTEVYDSFSDLCESLAVILGTRKESYTNASKLKKFFNSLGVEKPAKVSATKIDGTPIGSVWVSIIVNGYAQEYAKYLKGFIEQAKIEV